jgi:hypothetical protein
MAGVTNRGRHNAASLVATSALALDVNKTADPAAQKNQRTAFFTTITP